MDIRFRGPPGLSADNWAELVKHTLEGLARGYWHRYTELRGKGLLSELPDSGVVWRDDPGYGSGVERFASPEQSASEGWVDCDRAVLWALLDLWYRGQQATIRTAYSERHGDMHVLIRLPDNSLFDPAELFR